MLKKHFTEYIIWYVIVLSILIAGVTWYYFSEQINLINHQIKTHAVE